MKKKLFLAPLAAMILTVTGCGGGSTDYSDNTKLKIRFHVDIESTEGMAYDAMIKEFNATNEDGIKVTATFVARSAGDTTYDMQLAKDKKNNKLPDIITFDAPRCAAYATYGYLHDITDYFTNEEKAKFSTLNIYKNRMYGIPIQESSAGFFYNKNLFRQAGINVEGITVDNPWTYAQFKEACQKLKNIGVLPAIMSMKDTDSEMATYLLYPFIYSSGGGFVDEETGKTALGIFNSAGSKKGYQFLKDCLTNGYTNNTDTKEKFLKGNAGMYLSSGWTIPEIKEAKTVFPDRSTWGLLPYPKDETTSLKAFSANGSWCYAIGNNSRTDKTNVVKLLKYITNAQSSRRITNATGMIPVHKDAQTHYEANSAEDVLLQQLEKTGKARPNTVGYKEFSDVFRMVITNLKSSDVSTLVDGKAQLLQSYLNEK